ncbi:hypothetical protein INT45_009033 [Circinella minor]|uniref:Uncharacterized protein n=1 Tax=Circinella minor TaxID=1195481 RepID=A0A8H7S9Z5_9FUNG|nr:hypothetical protein INT45_009033 [Circinella minor]
MLLLTQLLPELTFTTFTLNINTSRKQNYGNVCRVNLNHTTKSSSKLLSTSCMIPPSLIVETATKQNYPMLGKILAIASMKTWMDAKWPT